MADLLKKQSTQGSIRPLAARDLEAVISLDAAISTVARRGFFESRLKAAIERPKEYVYSGLFEGDTLIGFAMARLIHGEFGQPDARASLDAISVAQEHQNHGAGHRLLAALKEVLTRKGVTRLESQVSWVDRMMPGFLGESGFELAPRMVLTRSTQAVDSTPAAREFDGHDPLEIDHSSPLGDQVGALSRDAVFVRSMEAADIDAIVRIDKKLSGQDRARFFQRKHEEAFFQSGARVSLIAEQDGFVVGYIMARVDFGEFGRIITEAVMDAFGVDSGFQGQGIGRALMSQLMGNLAILQVKHVRTEVAWNDVNIIAFLSSLHFEPAQRISLACNLKAG